MELSGQIIGRYEILEQLGKGGMAAVYKAHDTRLKREVAIFDMAGNFSEWVQDWYSPDYYQISPSNNPQGPLNGTFRIYRGASYNEDTEDRNVTIRHFRKPDEALGVIGFRCAQSISPSTLPTFTETTTPPSQHEGETIIPNIVGLKYYEAEATLGDNGYGMVLVWVLQSDLDEPVDSGYVVYQNPESGVNESGIKQVTVQVAGSFTSLASIQGYGPVYYNFEFFAGHEYVITVSEVQDCSPGLIGEWIEDSAGNHIFPDYPTSTSGDLFVPVLTGFYRIAIRQLKSDGICNYRLSVTRIE